MDDLYEVENRMLAEIEDTETGDKIFIKIARYVHPDVIIDYLLERHKAGVKSRLMDILRVGVAEEEGK